MSQFKLPDLGEGLPDAEIHEWFVKEGDKVTLDQPLVAMETAKAVVDVPSPQDGIVFKLFGKPGDLIKTGDPLIEFVSEAMPEKDNGTVVGNLEESTEITEDHFTIGVTQRNASRIKATPAVRLLAKKSGVDLNALAGSGEHGLITREDVERAANRATPLEDGYEVLHGVRRAMYQSMIQSHQAIVPVSLFDEADIDCWPEHSDITVRLIRAITEACRTEPALNAWFDEKQVARKCVDALHLGLAMDTDEGLFVPVIHHADTQSDDTLRQTINEYKQATRSRTLPADKLKGATFTLSNFGKFAGRFASPIIVPPSVAILAVGRLYQGAVCHQGQVKAHRLLPLSLSFDHRAITGGEATRFLKALIEALQKPE